MHKSSISVAIAVLLALALTTSSSLGLHKHADAAVRTLLAWVALRPHHTHKLIVISDCLAQLCVPASPQQ